LPIVESQWPFVVCPAQAKASLQKGFGVLLISSTEAVKDCYTKRGEAEKEKLASKGRQRRHRRKKINQKFS
jgi:hypothetical protein